MYMYVYSSLSLYIYIYTHTLYVRDGNDPVKEPTGEADEQ